MIAAADKQTLRQDYLRRREALEASVRHQADAAIGGYLRELSATWSLIGGYITDGTEPCLNEFLADCLESGKRVFLPRYAPGSPAGYQMAEITDMEQDLVSGKYCLKEPRPELPAATPGQMSNLTWLVPGVVFDMSGSRLGRGKGVYDRLLEGLPGVTIGIFYECQKCHHVPVEKHDRKLDMAVTEAGIIKFNMGE